MTNAEQRARMQLDGREAQHLIDAEQRARRLLDGNELPRPMYKGLMRGLLAEIDQLRETLKMTTDDLWKTLDQKSGNTEEFDINEEKEMSNYRKNMPEQAERYLRALLKDESYTWDGFAECIAKNTTTGDVEELIYLLKEHSQQGDKK